MFLGELAALMYLLSKHNTQMTDVDFLYVISSALKDLEENPLETGHLHSI